MPPPPCHPQSGPSQSGDLETRVVGDSVVSAKTPRPPNGKDPQLDLSNSPRGPSPNLSPALALSPRFRAPGAGPLLEGALRGGRNATPPGRPTRRSGPWRAPRSSPCGEPPSPLRPRKQASREARERRGWRGSTGPPPSGLSPPRIPQPRPERPPLTQRRGDTDCAGKAALLRRAAAEAAGGAGGGRGEGLPGRRPAAFARSPSPEGSPFLPFPSSPRAGGGGSGALDSAPAPTR